MADFVVIGCLFVLLHIKTCYGGLPGLDDGSLSQSTQEADSSFTDSMTTDLKHDMVHQLRYKCYQCEGMECTEQATVDGGSRVCHDALSCYKSSVRDSDGNLTRSRGCVVIQDHLLFTCKTNQQPKGPRKRAAGQFNVSCCRGDECNAGAFPPLPAAAADAAGASDAQPAIRAASPSWRVSVALLASALALLSLAALAVFLLRRTHRARLSAAALHKLGPDNTYFAANLYPPQITSAYYEDASQSGGQCVVRATAAGDSTLREYLECSISSGSGSGLPLMVQRTLAKQVSLIECVGKGRYGEVWRGQWYADSVAVKIFFSRDEASWKRETEIYSTVLLRHENILGYIGSDMTSRNSCTQLWLITHFHALGSLHEYLGRATLSRHQAMRLCLSAVNGLLHLHTDIHGTQGKPAIAHRDVKSKNILVKLDGECCIADLGLAVTRHHVAMGGSGGEGGANLHTRQGTKRYMSPELLDQSMNLECLESFLKCDIYAFALVMWEVWLRVASPASPPPCEHRPPFHEWVPHDPSFEDMRKIVCVDGARPPLPTDTHPTMVGMGNLMRECWHQNASIRLSALRLKRNMVKLANNDPAVRLALDDAAEVSV